jgi:hypothetical protein
MPLDKGKSESSLSSIGPIALAFVGSAPLVALAHGLELVLPMHRWIGSSDGGEFSLGRYVYFFGLAYISLVPLLAVRIVRSAVPPRSITIVPLFRRALISVLVVAVFTSIAAAPLLMAVLGPGSAPRVKGLYEAATHSPIGLWIVGSLFNFCAAMSVWMLASLRNIWKNQ